jgi:hypothetical protein
MNTKEGNNAVVMTNSETQILWCFGRIEFKDFKWNHILVSLHHCKGFKLQVDLQWYVIWL